MFVIVRQRGDSRVLALQMVKSPKDMAKIEAPPVALNAETRSDGLLGRPWNPVSADVEKAPS